MRGGNAFVYGVSKSTASEKEGEECGEKLTRS